MVSQFVKAIIAIGDKTVTFEGPPDFVEAQVAKFTGRTDSAENQVKASKMLVAQQSPSGALTERQIVAEKRPRNQPETVAVLAFCLAEAGKQEFTEDDIRRAYLRAVLRPPKVISQAIRDAKNIHDFIEPGSRRGSYRLSPHGDRTVRFDLPSAG